MNEKIKLSISSVEKALEKAEKKLLHYTGKAIHDYNMISHNDKILVCLSGGKDSFTLLMLLNKLRYRAKIQFQLASFTLDQAQPGWDDTGLRTYLDEHNIDYRIIKRDTYSIVKEKLPPGKTYCSLCSRLRRGIIYRYAKEHGFNKIALGHHRDDLITSFLMSIFYNGKTSSMPPKLLSDDHANIVIRPLVYVQERDIQMYAQLKRFPIIPCNLCGSQKNLARERTKKWIHSLALDNPKIPSNILRSLQNLAPSQLMDKRWWDFEHLESHSIQEEAIT